MTLTQSTVLPLKYGEFRISYHTSDHGDCVSVSHGDLSGLVPVVRLHSSCLFGESFHALDCECADQLTSTLQLIVENNSGILVYRYADGRGIGLENKIKALELQRTRKVNTVEAFKILGFRPDVRDYAAELVALDDVRVNKNIKAATQNPRKLAALVSHGYSLVGEIHPQVKVTRDNVRELITKKILLGYHISVEPRFGVE
jgi:3,4-dihydroxy 2-butanone 4-phosphate synthase / GTP cyclohydrolase II